MHELWSHDTRLFGEGALPVIDQGDEDGVPLDCHVMDALGLLAEAERAGFDPVRVDELTEELLAPDVPPSVVARAEGIARRWLAALDAESAGGLSDPDPSAALPPPPSA